MKIDNAQPQAAQSTRFVATVAKDAAVEKAPLAQSVLADEVAKSLSPEKSAAVVSQVNKVLKASGNDLEFKLDQDAGRMIVYLKDSQTGETLRQIPDETLLRISKNIGQYLDDLNALASKKDGSLLLSGIITDTKV